ncbi:hypothetical protein BJX66DRAFT_237364 [Aspergillus keveii]|uniref:Ankyrin repeat-containing protein n=1 Tax=Aspergillus keveii TaxID=714993 RepID=A0ABR4G1W0_9EURO
MVLVLTGHSQGGNFGHQLFSGRYFSATIKRCRIWATHLTSHAQLIDQLIKRGARIHDEYEYGHGAVLGAAIRKGDTMVLGLLLDAGATVLGSKLESIGSREAAEFLNQRGVLRVILQTCGNKVLSNAMFKGDLDLARWLLQPELIGAAMKSSEMDHLKVLNAAAASGDVSLIESVLDCGAKLTDSCTLACMLEDESTRLIFIVCFLYNLIYISFNCFLSVLYSPSYPSNYRVAPHFLLLVSNRMPRPRDLTCRCNRPTGYIMQKNRKKVLKMYR